MINKEIYEILQNNYDEYYLSDDGFNIKIDKLQSIWWNILSGRSTNIEIKNNNRFIYNIEIFFNHNKKIECEKLGINILKYFKENWNYGFKVISPPIIVLLTQSGIYIGRFEIEVEYCLKI